MIIYSLLMFQERVPNELNWLDNTIIFLPVVFSGFVLLFIYKRLKDNQLKLSEMLSENEVHKDADGNTTTIPKKSASRLIGFMSGMISLVLAISITSFYFYVSLGNIECNSCVDLGDFTNILLALGIGVVPYAVNQIKKI